jgi:ketosteroid isomerase-like protein
MAIGQNAEERVVGNADIDVVKAVFAAFAERDVEAVLAHADPEIVFATVTGEQIGRDEPYHGHDGMREYFRDVARVWEELRLVPQDFRQVGECVLVTGRVTARSPARIMTGSTGWIWRVVGGRVVYGRVYPSAGEAIDALRHEG